jgi:hypothetical protein
VVRWFGGSGFGGSGSVVRLFGFGFQWFGCSVVRVRGSVDLKQKKGRVNCGLGSGFGGSSIFYLDIYIKLQERKTGTISRGEMLK